MPIKPSRLPAPDPWDRRLRAASPVAVVSVGADSPSLSHADKLAQVGKGQRSLAIAQRSSKLGKGAIKSRGIRAFAGRINPIDVPVVTTKGGKRREVIRQGISRIRWEAPEPDRGCTPH